MTVVRLLDALAYSSVWVAAAAAALVAAASRALEIPFDLRLAGLAAAGTLLVYNVDRLRDLERDRLTAPVRSAFVERWRNALLGLAATAAAAAVALTWLSGPRVFLVLLPTAAAGLLHRRLKHLVWAKGGYIALSWTVVAVGLPAVTAAAPQNTLQVSVIVLLAVYANAIASNIRDAEAGAARIGLQRALHISRLVAGASLLVAAVGPTPVRPLLAVPLLTLGALVFFRADERYGLVVVDGALLGGALIAALSP